MHGLCGCVWFGVVCGPPCFLGPDSSFKKTLSKNSEASQFPLNTKHSTASLHHHARTQAHDRVQTREEEHAGGGAGGGGLGAGRPAASVVAQRLHLTKHQG